LWPYLHASFFPRWGGKYITFNKDYSNLHSV
jgi:hypothetical protein